jgi:hypothetical protein
MAETVETVAADTLGNSLSFAATGEFTGTISGVAGDDPQDREEQ